MILPKVVPQFEFRPHVVPVETSLRGNPVIIDPSWWQDLPDIAKWFVALHESFHVHQLASHDVSFNKELRDVSPIPRHYQRTWECEADLYACRILALAGYPLERISHEIDMAIGRYPYIPFSDYSERARFDAFLKRWREETKEKISKSLP